MRSVDPGAGRPVGVWVISDMTGGGVFHLNPGQWTDDTSMALCLAESLVEKDGFGIQPGQRC